MEIDSKLQGQMSKVFNKKIVPLINTKFDVLNINLNKRLDAFEIKLLKSIRGLPIIKENNISSIFLTSTKLNTQVTPLTSSHSSLCYTPYTNQVNQSINNKLTTTIHNQLKNIEPN